MTVKDSLMSIEHLRIDRCKKHKLVDILMIVFFGLLCWYKSIEEIHFYAELSIDVLKKYLELPNGIPSSDTILRVPARLGTKELENVFVEYAEVLILEKDIMIDKDEHEQEIEFNFDVENVLDGKELELEIIPKIIYSDKVFFDKKSVLIVGIGGSNE